ncbi:hypothetical protein A9Q98_14100 [Thalassotalea sp. 42_200_T64]|nr:hypothetical protein A9Q98_14100 [Thalassotalea sp. 42_200_T64]
MNFGMFETLPIIVVFFCVVLAMLVSCEVGYQLGKHFQTRKDRYAMISLGPMVVGLLGMLAFVLAFTFSMAASHHNLRKTYVIDEANVVGTAYLRADLLQMQYKKEVKRLLRKYVDIRLQAVVDIRLKGVSGTHFDAAFSNSIEIHQLLWTQVSTAAAKAPSLNTSLMIKSINNVIEMNEKRVTAGLHNRIPSSIWIAVLVICILTMITMGIQIGLTGKRRLIAVIPLSMAFAALFVLVVDLDRPQTGLIMVGQQAMINLQSNMDRESN